MRILLMVIGVIVAFSLVVTVIGTALGLAGALIGLALPLLLAGGFGYFVYMMFKRGFNSTRVKNRKAEPLEQTETEVVDDFRSFFQQK